MAATDPIADNVAAAVDVLKSIDQRAADLLDAAVRQADILRGFADATKSAMDRIIREIDHAANAATLNRAGPTGRNQPQQPAGGGLEAEVQRAADALYEAAKAATKLLTQVARPGQKNKDKDKPGPAGGGLEAEVQRAADALYEAAKAAAKLLTQVARPGQKDEEEDKNRPGPAADASKRLADVSRSLAVLSAAAATAALGVVTFATTVVGAITRWTSAFDPASTYMAELAVRNLTATLGRLLMPALQVAVEMTRALADTLVSLGPESAQLVSGLVLAGAAFAATAALAIGVAAAINFATGGLTGILSSILALTVGSVAFGAVMDTTGGVMESVRGVIEAFAPAIAGIASAATAVMGVLMPLVEAMAGALAPILQLLAGAVEVLAVLLTPLIVVLDGFATAIGWLADKLLTFLRWLGIIRMPDTPAVRRGGAAAAAAGPTANVMSAESYAQRAYAAAYTAGGENPVVRAVESSGSAIVDAIRDAAREAAERDPTTFRPAAPAPAPAPRPGAAPGAPAPAPGGP